MDELKIPEKFILSIREAALYFGMGEKKIRRLAEDGAQLFVATHSPILLGYPGAEILSFDGEAVQSVAYRDTDSYRVTHAFLTRYDKMIRDLFPKENE